MRLVSTPASSTPIQNPQISPDSNENITSPAKQRKRKKTLCKIAFKKFLFF